MINIIAVALSFLAVVNTYGVPLDCENEEYDHKLYLILLTH
jgi:hypothetical protein